MQRKWTSIHQGGRYAATSAEDPTAGFEVTAGLDLTPAYGVFLGRQMSAPPPPVPPGAVQNVKRLLIVLGAVALLAIVCWFGSWLLGSTVCPCTFGLDQADPAPASGITVDSVPVSCAGGVS